MAKGEVLGCSMASQGSSSITIGLGAVGLGWTPLKEDKAARAAFAGFDDLS